MTIPVHLAASWVVADLLGRNRRERTALALSGVVSDLDGVGYIIDRLTGTTDFYGAWHHVYGHGLVAATVMAVLCAFVCDRSLRIALCSLLISHLHFVLDLLSGKGPDDHIWGIQYWFPFSDAETRWDGQWYLHDWKNAVVGVCLIICLLVLAIWRKRSPLEMLSPRLDRWALGCFRSVFGSGQGTEGNREGRESNEYGARRGIERGRRGN